MVTTLLKKSFVINKSFIHFEDKESYFLNLLYTEIVKLIVCKFILIKISYFIFQKYNEIF